MKPEEAGPEKEATGEGFNAAEAMASSAEDLELTDIRESVDKQEDDVRAQHQRNLEEARIPNLDLREILPDGVYAASYGVTKWPDGPHRRFDGIVAPGGVVPKYIRDHTYTAYSEFELILPGSTVKLEGRIGFADQKDGVTLANIDGVLYVNGEKASEKWIKRNLKNYPH